MFGNRAALGTTIPAGSAWQSFALEAVLTGMLMLVIASSILRISPPTIRPMTRITMGSNREVNRLMAGLVSAS